MHLGGPEETNAVDETLLVEIVEAVAEQKGVDPLDIDEQLYDIVDPEALAILFRGTESTEGHVLFEMAGVQVRVSAEYEVSTQEVPETRCSGGHIAGV